MLDRSRRERLSSLTAAMVVAAVVAASAGSASIGENVAHAARSRIDAVLREKFPVLRCRRDECGVRDLRVVGRTREGMSAGVGRRTEVALSHRLLTCSEMLIEGGEHVCSGASTKMSSSVSRTKQSSFRANFC